MASKDKFSAERLGNIAEVNAKKLARRKRKKNLRASEAKASVAQAG